MGHSQQMLGQQSLFSSQDQLQEIHDVSEFNPVIMQQSEPQQEAQNDPRLYYEQCPKHGGPNRSPESHEDIVGSLATRPDDMVVKESSGKVFLKIDFNKKVLLILLLKRFLKGIF